MPGPIEAKKSSDDDDVCITVCSREATKCYCGASNCRGVIGSGKRSPLKSSRRKLTAKNKDKKKVDVFSDVSVSDFTPLNHCDVVLVSDLLMCRCKFN